MSNETTPTETADGALPSDAAPTDVTPSEAPVDRLAAQAEAAETTLEAVATPAPTTADPEQTSETGPRVVDTEDAPKDVENHRFAALATAATAAAGETRKLWDRYAPSRAELTETLHGLNTRVSASGKTARRVLDQVTEKISRRLELATVPSTSKLKQGAARLQSVAEQIRVPDLATVRSQASALADRLHIAELASSVSARLGIGAASKGDNPAGEETTVPAKAPAKRKAAPRKTAATKRAASDTESADAPAKVTRARTTARKTTGTPRRAASKGAADDAAGGTGSADATAPRPPRKRAPRKVAGEPAAPAETSADPSPNTNAAT